MEHLHPDDVLIFAKNGHQIILGDRRDILSALYDMPERFSLFFGAAGTDSLDLCLPLTLPQAHAYVALRDVASFYPTSQFFHAQGWQPFQHPLIWDAKRLGSVPGGAFFPSRRCSLFLFSSKGQKVLRTDCSDILRHAPDYSDPTPPVRFWDDILTRSSLPGDRILDPFGQLNLLRAANRGSRKITSIVSTVEKFEAFREYLK